MDEDRAEAIRMNASKRVEEEEEGFANVEGEEEEIKQQINQTDQSEDVTSKEHADLFAAVSTGTKASSTFPSWYQAIKEKMKESTGPLWIGKEYPFPYNSEFRPIKPPSDQLRQRVMTLWESDPKQWTPRRLSQRFKISMERICAIIKLKLLERQMVSQGFKINQEYVEGMEAILGVNVNKNGELGESVAAGSGEALSLMGGEEWMRAQRLRPMLVAIPEQAQLTAEEAAKLLGRRLRPMHQWIEAQITADAPYEPFSPTPPTNASSTVISEDASSSPSTIRIDAYEKARHRFVFIDTSNHVEPKSRQVLIREPTGELRHANRIERLREGHSIWGSAIHQFIQ